MTYSIPDISSTAELLRKRFSKLQNKNDILKAAELKTLFDELKTLPAEKRADFGKEVNELLNELRSLVQSIGSDKANIMNIDVTAPFDCNVPKDRHPQLLSSENGSVHPLMMELEIILDIFYRMGFSALESREIDDDYHMFGSLNFPEGHPARDDFDTFMTEQTDFTGKPLIAPAHTSVMQNRVLKAGKILLQSGQPIASVMPGRIFRNEDLDARHEHTFYQLEGIYVDKGVDVGNLIATLRAFLSAYYGREIKVMTQPFYFPFTEPSLEFAASCPFCSQNGCSICSHTGWIELGGCGLIHPNVLAEAQIDAVVYSGFAWGFGIERMVMIKYGIDDIRQFHSAKLDFLRQWS